MNGVIVIGEIQVKWVGKAEQNTYIHVIKPLIMKQLLDRIGYSILGIILLVFLEGIMTLGAAFHFDAYGWMAWMIQGMFVYLAIWVANKAYDHDNTKPKRPITF